MQRFHAVRLFLLLIVVPLGVASTARVLDEQASTQAEEIGGEGGEKGSCDAPSVRVLKAEMNAELDRLRAMEAKDKDSLPFYSLFERHSEWLEETLAAKRSEGECLRSYLERRDQLRLVRNPTILREVSGSADILNDGTIFDDVNDGAVTHHWVETRIPGRVLLRTPVFTAGGTQPILDKLNEEIRKGSGLRSGHAAASLGLTSTR